MLVSTVLQTAACRLLLLGLLSSLSVSAKVSNANLSHFTTTDGTTYAYDFTPAQGSRATFLLLHGYPSTHKDWELQIAALNAEGYGVLAPDMLGYGASDMPTDPQAFRGKRLANHMAELLDHTSLNTVIGVAHDWGTGVLSRLAVYHQHRFDKFVYLTVGHRAPGGFLDIDGINAMGVAEFGYMPYGYWYFFDRYDAASVIKSHLESHWHLVFPENHTLWVNHLAAIGAARAWLQGDTRTNDPSYLDQDYKSDWMDWMSRPNAVESGLNCYRSEFRGFNDADEAKLEAKDWEFHVPVLAIAGSKDPIGRPDLMIQSTEPWAVAGFESKVLDAGHWLARERPDELNELLLEFAR